MSELFVEPKITKKVYDGNIDTKTFPSSQLYRSTNKDFHDHYYTVDVKSYVGEDAFYKVKKLDSLRLAHGHELSLFQDYLDKTGKNSKNSPAVSAIENICKKFTKTKSDIWRFMQLFNKSGIKIDTQEQLIEIAKLAEKADIKTPEQAVDFIGKNLKKVI